MQERNKEIVKKSIAVFCSRNYKIYLNYFSDNIKWNIVGMPVIIGKDEFIRALKSLELVNFSSSDIKNIISEGEFVAVESNGNKNRQVFNSCKPAHCDIYRLKNGKIYELTSYIVDTTSTNDYKFEIMSHKFKDNNNV